jgi:uncharacterized membrane protein
MSLFDDFTKITRRPTSKREAWKNQMDEGEGRSYGFYTLCKLFSAAAVVTTPLFPLAPVMALGYVAGAFAQGSTRADAEEMQASKNGQPFPRRSTALAKNTAKFLVNPF